MGCGYNYLCRTCKKSYYCGYGSYRTWFTTALTIAEWNQRAQQAPEDLTLHKNQCILHVLLAHDGHDIYPTNWDYHAVDEEGALTGQFGIMGQDVVVVDDYNTYAEIDLYEELKHASNR